MKLIKITIFFFSKGIKGRVGRTGDDGKQGQIVSTVRFYVIYTCIYIKMMERKEKS